MRAIILLSHGHRNRQREINQPQSWTRAGTTTAKGTHKNSSPQPGQRGHKRGQCTAKGERIQAYCDEQKTHREKHNKTSHPPRDTHPTTPTPATPGKNPNISAPLTHNPAQNPLNHTQTTDHDQRRWGMLNFLSPNTQAEPSTLQHAKQPGTLY